MEPMDIEDGPSLDLESYITQFSGNVCLQRLKFFVNESPPSPENYKLLIETAMDCKNIPVYSEAVEALYNTFPLDAVSSNVDWITQTSKYLTSKVDRLEQDLNNYQLSRDKENIRRTHQSLGDHYHDCGDLSNAIKHYQKSRDYGTTVYHTFDFCMNIIKVSVYLNHWTSVSNYIKKADAVEVTEALAKRKLGIATALSQFCHGQYNTAGHTLSAIMCDTWTNEILSPNCIAIYTALCALAAFDRKELHSLLIENNNFKQYLEMEPTVRDCMYSFYNRNYSAAFAALKKLKASLKLDIFLSSHVDAVYDKIRSRSLCQYFTPYNACDMNKMADAFNTDVDALELELMKLVPDLPARIDSFNKILRSCESDNRALVFEDVLNLSLRYKQKTQALLVKSVVLKAGLVVKAPTPIDEKPSSSYVVSSCD